MLNEKADAVEKAPMSATSMPKTSSAGPRVVSVKLEQESSQVRMDWVVMAFPTIVAITSFSSKLSLLLLGLITAVTFVRKRTVWRSVQAGPLVLLVASTAIVSSRPDSKPQAIAFALVVLLVIRLMITVDARQLIASLIDGAGIYLVVNIITYAAGLRSPGAAERIGEYTESSGFVRTIYPLSGSLEVAPTVASVYIAGAAFLLFERGWQRRSIRCVFLAAALIVLWQAGSRTALLTAVALPLLAFCFPVATRYIAQVVTLFSSVSALYLPSLISSVQFAVIPALSLLAPDRDTRNIDITSLNSRDSIWTSSVSYWMNYVNGMHDRLLGFGQNGHIHSGASWAYADALASTVRHPERASMHNSFLQQLFDGGLAGWLLLTLAILWTSIRLSRRRRDWGPQGIAAILAIVALLINAMTQVSISPGIGQMGFWLLIVLVGVACQSPVGASETESLGCTREDTEADVPTSQTGQLTIMRRFR